MSSVFISHSSQDFLQAQVVSLTLEQCGIACVMLPRDTLPGESYAMRIPVEIAKADAVVFLLSKAFLASPQCCSEVVQALEAGKRRFPISLEKDLEKSPGFSQVQHALAGIHGVQAIFEAEHSLPGIQATLLRLAESVKSGVVVTPSAAFVEPLAAVSCPTGCGASLEMPMGKNGKPYFKCPACRAMFTRNADGAVGKRFDKQAESTNQRL